MANMGWCDLFLDVKLVNLLAPISDHSPILLDKKFKVETCFRKSFKFKNKWLLE